MHPLTSLYRCLGNRTYERGDNLWIKVGRFTLIKPPCGKIFDVNREELDDLLQETGALAGSFATSLATGVDSIAYTIQDPNYGIHSVKRQFRQHLKRHENRCEVRQIDWKQLRDEGLSINRDTARQRQDVAASYADPHRWAEFCEVVSQDENLVTIGCLVNGKLAAFSVAWIDGNRCDGLMMHHHSELSDFRPSHKVIHGLGRIMIARPDISQVCSGRDMIPRQASIAQFKRSAGFESTPIRVAVVIHPNWRRLLTNPWSRRGFRHLRHTMGSRFNALENSQVFDVAAVTQI